MAFSGGSGSQVSYTTPSTPSASTTIVNVFAAQGADALLSSGVSASDPILPPNITLNVNYAGATGSCTDADSFEFVLSRINVAAAGAPADVETCEETRLPTETSVVARSGCFASVSVMNATTKGDVDATTQAFVLGRLESFLSC